jgi:hypothetical protein
MALHTTVRGLLGGIAAAGLSLGLLSAPAAAQDEWTQQVQNLLARASDIAKSNGMSMTHNIFTGSLNRGATTYVTADLNFGKSYQMVGVCDNDCSDVDLEIYDPSGNKVASDVLDDDTPVVSLQPGKSGTYRIKVMMIKCSADPCRFGIGIYGR